MSDLFIENFFLNFRLRIICESSPITEQSQGGIHEQCNSAKSFFMQAQTGEETRQQCNDDSSPTQNASQVCTII